MPLIRSKIVECSMIVKRNGVKNYSGVYSFGFVQWWLGYVRRIWKLFAIWLSVIHVTMYFYWIEFSYGRICVFYTLKKWNWNTMAVCLEEFVWREMDDQRMRRNCEKILYEALINFGETPSVIFLFSFFYTTYYFWCLLFITTLYYTIYYIRYNLWFPFVIISPDLTRSYYLDACFYFFSFFL